MLLAVRGSREALAARPPLHNMVAVYNPLYHDEDNAAQILLSVEYGIPLDIAVMSIVGMTSPATLAGSLAQTVAEELATITLIQSARPGHPCAFFVDPVVGNMRNGEALAGAPESALLLGAICQLGTELFGVPTSAIGLDTDGFSGAQTMFQKAQNLAFEVLAGGTVVVGRRLRRDHHGPEPGPARPRRRVPGHRQRAGERASRSPTRPSRSTS